MKALLFNVNRLQLLHTCGVGLFPLCSGIKADTLTDVMGLLQLKVKLPQAVMVYSLNVMKLKGKMYYALLHYSCLLT